MTAEEKKILEALEPALAGSLDPRFKTLEFLREPGQLTYVRQYAEGVHELILWYEAHPSYEPDALIYLQPRVLIRNQEITAEALRMVKGQKVILSNAPDIILNFSLQEVLGVAGAGKNLMPWPWMARDLRDLPSILDDIGATVEQDVDPWLQHFTSADTMAAYYRVKGHRTLHFQAVIFAAAAYRLAGDRQTAADLINEKLGKPGLRPQFEPVFEFLAEDGS